jgi:two-component system, NarL family, response regulator NreC
MKDPITIGLVEDQLLFREGMKAILNSWPDINVVFEAGNGHAIIENLQATSPMPEVLLLDLALPPLGDRPMTGIEITKLVRTAFPEMKVLILSMHHDEKFIARIIENGAHGYLVKDSSPEEVYQAITSVHGTGSYINAATLKAIQQSMSKKSRMASNTFSVPLSGREKEVLTLICQQLTSEEISEKLYLSVKTINGHRNNLLQKTSARNTAGLVLFAVKNGLVEL